MIITGWISTVLPAAAQSEPAVVYLKNGQTNQGEVLSVRPDRIELKLPNLEAGALGIFYREMLYTDFPDPPAWRQAMQAFFSNDYEEAATKLESIAASRTSANFYPAPGNFSTLADRRLLDCYRRSLKPEKIPAVYRRLEWDKLPPDERKAEVVSELWAVVGEAQWDQAIQIANRLEKNLEAGDWNIIEISYLRGLAYENKMMDADAIISYGGVIGPYHGLNRRISSDAIKRSAGLLAKDPERTRELKALVHIYAKSFGNGKLWDGATSEMTKMLSEPIKTGS